MSATTKDLVAEITGNDHAHCLMCGACNPRSLGLSFEVDGDAVRTTFQARPTLQGYTGILHGGVVASLLDSAMTHCLFHHGVRGLTGDLHVRFVWPVPCDAPVEVCAWILSVAGPLYRMRAELRHDQRVMAWAEAKFMQRREP
jgi:acyl-coenzyme A thioesterase PaaI-like protein